MQIWFFHEQELESSSNRNVFVDACARVLLSSMIGDSWVRGNASVLEGPLQEFWLERLRLEIKHLSLCLLQGPTARKCIGPNQHMPTRDPMLSRVLVRFLQPSVQRAQAGPFSARAAHASNHAVVPQTIVLLKTIYKTPCTKHL